MPKSESPKVKGSLHGSVGAILLAAGESRRMDGVDKAFIPILGKPLLAYSLDVLQKCLYVDEIALVMGVHNLEKGKSLVREGQWGKVNRVCIGGARRQDSVRNGLENLTPLKWVLVHDGARPFIDNDMILRGLESARETGAAVAAVPVKDTIKMADGSGLVKSTPSRSSLWSAQTPQLFKRELLLEAHAAIQDDVTDDSTMVERLGYNVKLFMGSYDNIKVTTTQDVKLAEAILSSPANSGS